jgi:protein lifeguard
MRQYPKYTPYDSRPSNPTLTIPIAEPYHDQSLNNFNSIENRNPFIRKVYTNLTIMWIITALSCYGFMYNKTMKTFAATPQAYTLLIFSIILLFGTVIIAACSTDFVRKFPNDYIILCIFTVAQAYMLGVSCAYKDIHAILLAAFATLVITITMTIFACQTTYDCTGMGSFLFTSLTGIICINIVNLFVKSDTVNLLAACASIVIFTGYLIYDTQLIVGGDHKYAFSTEEHAFATISLYLDIANLFVNLLQIFDRSN